MSDGSLLINTLLPLFSLGLSIYLAARLISDAWIGWHGQILLGGFIAFCGIAIISLLVAPPGWLGLLGSMLALLPMVVLGLWGYRLRKELGGPLGSSRAVTHLQDQKNILLFSVFNDLSDAVLITNIKGMVVFMNETAVSSFGDHIGFPCSDVLGCDRNDCHDCRVRDDGKKQKARLVREMAISGRYYELTLDRVYGDAEGKTILIARDLTVRRMAEQQVLLNEKMLSLGQLVAGVNHEINNPIASVAANLEIIEMMAPGIAAFQEKIRDTAAQADSDEMELKRRIGEIVEWAKDSGLTRQLEEIPGIVSDMREAVGRVRHLVRDLKEFSHPGSEEAEEAELSSLIDLTLRIAKHQLKRIEVSVSHAPDAPKIVARTQELNQAFLNLFVNAAHALEGQQDGKLTIASSFNAGNFTIRIADNGPGIPDELRDRIFNPFFTTKEVGKGTGLGLAVVYGIVQRHGGTIDVDSKAGEGTVFTLTLPRIHPDEAARQIRE